MTMQERIPPEAVEDLAIALAGYQGMRWSELPETAWFGSSKRYFRARAYEVKHHRLMEQQRDRMIRDETDKARRERMNR